MEHGAVTLVPLTRRSDIALRWLAAGVFAGLVVCAFLGLVIAPSRINLSLTAGAQPGGNWTVLTVLPGGLAYDAGVRPGTVLAAPEGGRIDDTRSPALLVDPVRAERLSPAGGAPQLVDARVLYSSAGGSRWVKTLVGAGFAVAAGALLVVRIWDVTARRVALFFLALASVLTLGTFSGAWGGGIPILLQGVALSSTGLSLAALAGVFPHPLPAKSRVEQALFTAALVWLAGFQVVQLVANFSITIFAPLARQLISLYLLYCLGVVAYYQVRHYRRIRSPVRLLQWRVAAASVVVGLSPFIVLGVAPLLLFQRSSLVPVDTTLLALTLIPAGISYALIEPSFGQARVQTQRAFTFIALLFMVFMLAAGVVPYVNPVVDAGDQLPGWWAFIIGGVAVLALVCGLMLRRVVDHGLGRVTPAPEPQGPDTPEREAAVQAARQDERARVLSQIHDGPVQTATRLAMRLDMAPGVPESAKQELNRLIEEMRGIIHAGSLVVVPPEELVVKLNELAAETERRMGAAVSVLSRGFDPNVCDRGVTTAAFYATREALNNAAKHSNATEVIVNLTLTQGKLALTIQDNGVGFDPNAAQRLESFGLRSMRSRVEEQGGELKIASGVKAGTQVQVTIPLTVQQRAAAQ